MNLKLSTLVIALLCSLSFKAQKLHYEISENASKMYELKNYKRAKELYRDLYKKDLTNKKNKYRFSVCLIYTHEREDGIKMLEAIAKKPGLPNDLNFHLARAYHLENRYDKAIKLYNKFISNNPSNELLKNEAERNIEMCNNAKQLIKTPLNVDFENLTKSVNSKGDDYLPFTTPDESLLFFSTRREGTTGRIYDMEGYYTSDIYTAKYKYGKWSKARSVGSPNSYGNEQTAGISENGKFILYYVNNPKSKNNLQLGVKSRSSFKRPSKIPSKKINIGSSKQISATVSNEGDFLIFSSDRDGGYGGHDLYISKKLPDGKWGAPKNLGEKINTPYDELYPNLADNNTSLFFASKGHNSIGGFDIFSSIIDLTSQSFGNPTNIGYPINTPDDNFNISFNTNKKYGYVSTYRNDSEGGLDIYRVNFKDADPLYTTVKGFVVNADSTIFNTPLKIEVFNQKGGDLYGTYEVNQNKGSYIMILPPNRYEIRIEIPEEGYFTQKMVIGDRNKYKPEITKVIKVEFINEDPIE